jgi:hypothetical protein
LFWVTGLDASTKTVMLHRIKAARAAERVRAMLTGLARVRREKVVDAASVLQIKIKLLFAVGMLYLAQCSFVVL